MSTPIENVDPGPTRLTPVMRRLLNQPLLRKGRSALVMSQSKRERLARKEKELADFRAQHPWWGEIEGWQREIFRKILFSLDRAGRGLEADRFDRVFFIVGDALGKEVIWPFLSHLLNGGTFHCHGIEICGHHPNVQKLPSIPLQEFLENHVPAGTRPGPLVVVDLLLKALACLEGMVWSSQNKENPAKDSAALTAAQVPIEAEE